MDPIHLQTVSTNVDDRHMRQHASDTAVMREVASDSDKPALRWSENCQQPWTPIHSNWIEMKTIPL
jgi:hypothetical protein